MTITSQRPISCNSSQVNNILQWTVSRSLPSGDSNKKHHRQQKLSGSKINLNRFWKVFLIPPLYIPSLPILAPGPSNTQALVKTSTTLWTENITDRELFFVSHARTAWHNSDIGALPRHWYNSKQQNRPYWTTPLKLLNLLRASQEMSS